MNSGKLLKNIFVTIVAFIILAFGSNSDVQAALSYYGGLNDDWTEVKYPSKKSELDGKIERATISRVVDGDTVVLQDGRTIRYLYIDTPETHRPNTPVQCFGPEASSYNGAFKGAKVLLKSDKEGQDKYGRDLRIVFLDGRDTDNISQSINAQLVVNGFARVKVYKPNNTFETELTELQTKAQKENKGIWKACSKPFQE
jgi:micrococcal nuclease